ncbi:MAG TPA: hypothetical protein VJB35_01890 [Candidatus Nanoarchaeia archaeon]|nr:hypothetical protein [Candidatus Nanoarchaeia archaeon]
MAKTKGIEVGKFVQRNNMLKKIGLDTDNCISWIENEKLSPGYKPRIAKRRNFLYTNYVVFSELMHLISNKDLTIKSEEVIGFLKRNHIRPIKKKDVDKIKVEETFNKLKAECKKNNWSAGESDLRVISVYYNAGIDCISTNNLRHFKDPCYYLKISLDFPPIIQPYSKQDVNRMLRNLYKNH